MGPPEAPPHRPPTPTLEIGGTHVTAALVDLGDTSRPMVRGAVRARLVASEPADAVVGRIVACADELAAPAGAAWGVAVPGPFDYDEGVALFEDVGKFDALRGLDLRETLTRRLRARPADIRFLNDAEAFLRGEWVAGAARGCERAIGLTLGTGIGSAFLADGAMVVDGPLVPPGGSVHRLEVDGAPLEEAVSSRAIVRRYAAAASGRARDLRDLRDVDQIGEVDQVDPIDQVTDVREIAARAMAGDEAARAVFDDAFTALGLALGPWLARFRPSVLVLGGSIARSWDLVAPPLRHGLSQGRPAAGRARVVPAAIPEQAALVGAGWTAVNVSPVCPSGTGW